MLFAYIHKYHGVFYFQPAVVSKRFLENKLNSTNYWHAPPLTNHFFVGTAMEWRLWRRNNVVRDCDGFTGSEKMCLMSLVLQDVFHRIGKTFGSESSYETKLSAHLHSCHTTHSRSAHGRRAHSRCAHSVGAHGSHAHTHIA